MRAVDNIGELVAASLQIEDSDLNSVPEGTRAYTPSRLEMSVAFKQQIPSSLMSLSPLVDLE